jgi:hypothetical protein
MLPSSALLACIHNYILVIGRRPSSVAVSCDRDDFLFVLVQNEKNKGGRWIFENLKFEITDQEDLSACI